MISKLEELGDYKDSKLIIKELNECKSVLSKLNSNEKTIETAVFVQAKSLIDNGKYVKFTDDMVSFVEFYYRFLGSWTYYSGDDRILSYIWKESSQFDHVKDIEVKYKKSSTNASSIEVNAIGSDSGVFGISPSVDINAGTITCGGYMYRKWVLTSGDNKLRIDFYGESSQYPEHSSVEYTRK